MCGDQAVFECPECYENETTELSAAAFCEPCSQTVSYALLITQLQLQPTVELFGIAYTGSLSKATVFLR